MNWRSCTWWVLLLMVWLNPALSWWDKWLMMSRNLDYLLRYVLSSTQHHILGNILWTYYTVTYHLFYMHYPPSFMSCGSFIIVLCPICIICRMLYVSEALSWFCQTVICLLFMVHLKLVAVVTFLINLVVLWFQYTSSIWTDRKLSAGNTDVLLWTM